MKYKAKKYKKYEKRQERTVNRLFCLRKKHAWKKDQKKRWIKPQKNIHCFLRKRARLVPEEEKIEQKRKRDTNDDFDDDDEDMVMFARMLVRLEAFQQNIEQLRISLKRRERARDMWSFYNFCLVCGMGGWWQSFP